MEKPKDIAAGDWDTAFALCEQEFGELPCEEWQTYLRKFQTVSEAFAGPGPEGPESYEHSGSWSFTFDIDLGMGMSEWYQYGTDRAAPESVAKLIAYLRDRLLAK